jgi:hypothetical protein
VLESVAAPSAVLPVDVTVASEPAAERALGVTVVVLAAVAVAAVGGEVARYSVKPSLQHWQYHFKSISITPQTSDKEKYLSS